VTRRRSIRRIIFLCSFGVKALMAAWSAAEVEVFSRVDTCSRFEACSKPGFSMSLLDMINTVGGITMKVARISYRGRAGVTGDGDGRLRGKHAGRARDTYGVCGS
jgi:hypothetical protein